MYRSILIPLDGSDRAEKILPHAKEIAHKFGSELILTQILLPIYRMSDAHNSSYFHLLQREMDAMESGARSYLEGLKEELHKEGISATIRIESGEAVQAILRIAREEDVDLIAMGSHGRTGLPRIFFGSVAAGVLHGTDRPLLIIRALDG